jgi:hypothetical protein
MEKEPLTNDNFRKVFHRWVRLGPNPTTFFVDNKTEMTEFKNMVVILIIGMFHKSLV